MESWGSRRPSKRALTCLQCGGRPTPPPRCAGASGWRWQPPMLDPKHGFQPFSAWSAPVGSRGTWAADIDPFFDSPAGASAPGCTLVQLETDGCRPVARPPLCTPSKTALADARSGIRRTRGCGTTAHAARCAYLVNAGDLRRAPGGPPHAAMRGCFRQTVTSVQGPSECYTVHRGRSCVRAGAKCRWSPWTAAQRKRRRQESAATGYHAPTPNHAQSYQPAPLAAKGHSCASI